MASSPSPSSSAREMSNKGKEGSDQLPPLPPKIHLTEDLFQNECRIPNYDTGFETAPSSPPHASVSADPLPPHKESTTEISSLSPKMLQQPYLGPSPVVLQGRDVVPSHHLLKVESFSSLSEIEKYSSEFAAGGYKWNLTIYPNGDKNKDGEGHISIYLEMRDTRSMSAGWEVNAIFNFFIFDQIRDKYVGPQDATVRRFHCLKTQWGIVKFMDLQTFNNPSNGYLVNDTCSFGVEVFIVKTTSKAERLSMIKNPRTREVSWKFQNVLKGRYLRRETERFVAGDYDWCVWFFPNGYQEAGKGDNNNITLALKLNSTLPVDTKLFVHYTFRVVDQKKDKHVERSESSLISSLACGIWEFMSQPKFKDPENGFLVHDTCIVEAEIKVLGLVILE